MWALAIRTGSLSRPRRFDPAAGSAVVKAVVPDSSVAGVPGETDAPAPLLRPIAFSEISGWDDDDHAAAFRAFRAGCVKILETPSKTRSLGVSGADLQEAARLAMRVPDLIGERLSKTFFESCFIPHRIEAPGFVTGYYEPEVAASRTCTDRFVVPLYRRPNDLLEVTAAERPPGWDPEIRFARDTGSGLTPFFDRAAIQAGALAGRGLEIAWLEDPVDAFFVHVQGSARLRLTDGQVSRIAFDGKSGHLYTSIGRLAVDRGVLAREMAHKDGLETWLKSHPEEGGALMRENRSFIFFRETELADTDGPLGAAGVSLTPGRSLAVDRTLHTFHAPIWVDALSVSDPDRVGRGFRRLMVAQDTGSAILGPARGDLFLGSGGEAGSLAGRVSDPATMTLFVPVRSGGAE